MNLIAVLAGQNLTTSFQFILIHSKSFEMEVGGPTIPAPTLVPALKPNVHTPVAISVAVITALLTLAILLKLLRIFSKGLTPFSNFNFALLLTLAWGVLRTVLFVLYARDEHVANKINVSILLAASLLTLIRGSSTKCCLQFPFVCSTLLSA